MFEYLMPLLVMPTYENTLLDQTYKAAVKWQIDYGKKAGLPWGISESGYNMMDTNSQLSIPRIWRSRSGIETRTGRRFCYCPLCICNGIDGSTGKSLRKPGRLSEKGFEGQIWIL